MRQFGPKTGLHTRAVDGRQRRLTLATTIRRTPLNASLHRHQLGGQGSSTHIGTFVAAERSGWIRWNNLATGLCSKRNVNFRAPQLLRDAILLLRSIRAEHEELRFAGCVLLFAAFQHVAFSLSSAMERARRMGSCVVAAYVYTWHVRSGVHVLC